MLTARIAAFFVSLLILCGGSSSAVSATRVVGAWKGEQVASLKAEMIRLRTAKDGVVHATVRRSHVVKMMDVLARLQAQAGITTEFLIIQLSDNTPNAFARVVDEERNVVGITPGMLQLLGDDHDAYAAVLGHEITHLTKRHGALREARRGFFQALGFIAGALVGARTGFNPESLINLGSEIVNRSFSREEEREADKGGLDLMMAAGFNPEGAIRAHEKLLAVRSATPLAFLATHPGGEERLAMFRQMIASLPARTTGIAAANTPSTAELSSRATTRSAEQERVLAETPREVSDSSRSPQSPEIQASAKSVAGAPVTAADLEHLPATWISRTGDAIRYRHVGVGRVHFNYRGEPPIGAVTVGIELADGGARGVAASIFTCDTGEGQKSFPFDRRVTISHFSKARIEGTMSGPAWINCETGAPAGHRVTPFTWWAE